MIPGSARPHTYLVQPAARADSLKELCARSALRISAAAGKEIFGWHCKWMLILLRLRGDSQPEPEFSGFFVHIHTYLRYLARIAHSLREIEHSKNFLSANPAGRGYRFSLCCCLLHAAASLRALAASAGFPLQNIDAQRQQGRRPWGQPTEGLCTTRRAGSACRAHPPPPAGLCAGRRAGNPSRFMCAHGLHRAVRVRCPCCCCVCS